MADLYANLELIREEVGDLLEEMENALLELEGTPNDMSLINRVFRAMHTIKGAADMFGLDHITAITHEVETAYDAVRREKLSVNRELMDVSFLVKDVIGRLMEDLEAPTGADYADTLERVRAICITPDGDVCRDEETGGPATAGDTPHDAGETEPSDPEEDLDDDQPVAPRHFAISFFPTAPDFLETTNPLGILDELREMGETQIFPVFAGMGNAGTLALRDLDPTRCLLGWDILIQTVQDANELRDVFIFVENISEVTIAPEDEPEAWLEARRAAAEAPPEPAARPAEVLAAEPEPEIESADIPDPTSEATGEPVIEPETAVEPEPVVGPAAAPAPEPQPAQKDRAPCQAAPQGRTGGESARENKARAARKEVSSVRVDAFKLDDMVALVGELVIAQARLNQVSAKLADPTLQAVAEEIDLLAANLRDRTLSMRMLPIGTTFDRFRRLVRDLSHELGKEIILVTRGAETELDKTVIEQLGDPLVHLLRNSIDHGIEQPAAREAAGKDAEGTLLLSAEHSGGSVLIRIQDDGKGLDREQIAAKAVERGLVTDPDAMSDTEIFNLIFLPGFSTADKVTNVSGRGVGMDVVKKSIDHLRGSVSIDSRKGEGSTVTIKLPLTLAIIEGLQVRSGDEFFVLPLAAVEECIELPPEEKGNGGGRKKIVDLRNEIVPYIRLREWFDIAGEPPEIEQIIITGGSDNQRTGIVVDEVIGQQQTVIKSLGKVFANVQEISGATIKGDGTMALILDVPYLVRTVREETA